MASNGGVSGTVTQISTVGTADATNGLIECTLQAFFFVLFFFSFCSRRVRAGRWLKHDRVIIQDKSDMVKFEIVSSSEWSSVHPKGTASKSMP